MTRTPKGWMFTLGLAALAILGALAARTVTWGPSTDLPTVESVQTIAVDSCFRYGRLECCIKE